MKNNDLKHERLLVTKDEVVTIDDSLSTEDMIFQLNSNFPNYEWMNYVIDRPYIWLHNTVWVRDPNKLYIHHLNQ